MRKLIAAAGALALGLTMTACSQASDAGKDGGDAAGSASQVGVVTWWEQGSEKEGFDALKKVFAEQHPDVELVKPVSYTHLTLPTTPYV